jgi:hypothetical protein
MADDDAVGPPRCWLGYIPRNVVTNLPYHPT